MPFGKYKDFAECVTNQKKKGFSDERARKICATIHKKITGKWPTELKDKEVNKMEKEKVELARGDGQGVGGPRQGLGPAKYCKCTKCGNKINHIPNHPCADYVCPKCGGNLIGTDK